MLNDGFGFAFIFEQDINEKPAQEWKIKYYIYYVVNYPKP